MGKINLLSFEIANLIAAGEVVERPSSVLKELIENSIDSGATQIVAEIKRGGVALIRVTDNGCGMEKEDLPIALKRHATSKIKEKEDLDSIMTLGFRGEALAAIASVSEMTIISKTSTAESATMLTAEAGSVVDISEVGASDGTTVVVENLFYNVPARRKFLKKDSTEAMNVVALVEKVALSRPDISIQLLIDGEERFKTPGDSDLKNTIYAVFGRDFASKLIKAEGVANGIRVSGYIGRSDNVKRNRNYQNVFINGRYVKSLTAMAAIEKAYTSYIAPEAFPVCVLFIEMNPASVDVNVHPAKLEVKFSDERVIFESIYYTVKSALEDYEYRPEMTLAAKHKNDRNILGAFVPVGENTRGVQISIPEAARPSVSTQRPVTFEQKVTAPKPSFSFDSVYPKAEIAKSYDRPVVLGSSSTSASQNKPKDVLITPKNSLEILESYKNATPDIVAQPTKEVKSEVKEREQQPAVDYKIVGEAFDCYVIVESEGALLLIDKHAAHERIIFEDLKKQMLSGTRTASQALLLPVTVLLSPEELSFAREFYSDLAAVGYEYTINGGAADITAIPDSISVEEASSLFVKMLDEIIEGRGDPETTESIRREKALYQIACKAAIKGGRVYDKAVIEWLVGRVFELPDVTVCPHGRPIAYRLTKNELDRQFERIK